MLRFISLLLVALMVFLGFWFEKGEQADLKQVALVEVHPEKDFPLAEHKSFVFVVYAHNQALWCERALRSIFEQEYDHYRVVLIDDGSLDGTAERARQFILETAQDQKVLLIRNETPLGQVASLYRAVDNCLDREIVIPLNAKDWLATPATLSKLNKIFQNPDVWVSFGEAVCYPSYEISPPQANEAPCAFYSGLFKQIRLQDLYAGGEFASHRRGYLVHLLKLSGGRIRHLFEPIAFLNQAASQNLKEKGSVKSFSSYKPLADFPKPSTSSQKADIVLFSYNRPLQLYSCLESLQRYVSGFDRLTVLYRASDPSYSAGYEKVKEAFPFARFVAQSENPQKDFKPHLTDIVFGSKAGYVLFGMDDSIAKDFVDLLLCIDQMERTSAHAFYLRLGRHIHLSYQKGKTQEVPPSFPLSSGIFAWDMRSASDDWSCPHSLDMALFQKARLKEVLSKEKFGSPQELEDCLAKQAGVFPPIGLYFACSKMVSIPLNGSVNFLAPEELLVKFNQGLKMDIEPLYKIENSSPYMDYIPEFIAR